MAFSDLVAVTDRAVQGHLGGTIRYTPEFGDVAIEVPGVFDASYLLRDLSGGGPGVETYRPAVFVRVADLPDDSDNEHAGALIEANGTTYRVRERQPDGMGGMVLVLTEVE